MNMKNNKASRRKLLSAFGATTIVAMPLRWLTPVVSSIALPAHAQTSMPLSGLCIDGVSTWSMSEYQENGVSFNQGNPQSTVEITISGTQITLVTDVFVINSSTSSESRGRVTDVGTIDLNTGEASTSPTGSPVASPTHGGVSNLANNLDQTFTLDCDNSNSFVVQDTSSIYSFRLTRIT